MAKPTATPGTVLVNASVTVTVNGVGNTESALADCELPAVIVRFAAAAGVMLNVPDVATGSAPLVAVSV